MFTLNDMMEMVKAGKTTEEIKELYELGKEIESNAGAREPAGEPKDQQKEPDDKKPAKEDQKDLDGDSSGDPDPDDDIDWKKEYEELKAKYQQENVRKNMQGQFDDQKSSIEKGLDILSEMIR